MEALLMILLLIGVGFMIKGWMEKSPSSGSSAASTPDPESFPAAPGREFAKLETVEVDDPSQLAAAIESVRYRHTQSSLFASGLILGEPQISDDGRRANIPLWRDVN